MPLQMSGQRTPHDEEYGVVFQDIGFGAGLSLLDGSHCS
jgi:hypothetical protein